MKTNRYADAIRAIEPDDDFIQKTLQKMEKPQRKAPFFAISAAALTACVLIAALIVLPLGKSPAAGNKSKAAETADPMRQVAAVDAVQKNTELPRAAVTGAPIPRPNPTAEPDYGVFDDCEEEPFEAGGFAMDGMALYGNAMYASAPMNTEEYSAVTESGFKSVFLSPLSTFAADVDTAGYSIVRRKLLDGQLPSAQAVRIEELINYFSYPALAPKDDSPIAITTCLAPCDWNPNAALLMVGIGTSPIENEALPPSNLVFLVDTSGSMDSPDKLDLIKQAFGMVTQNLRPCDTVSLVTYAGSDRVMLEGIGGDNRTDIMQSVSDMTAWGSTNGSAGIITAYALAEKYFIPGGNNRVILMTDGDLNVGAASEAALVELIEAKKQSGVFLSVYGFGMGNYKDNKMEALADHGNGVYAYIDSLYEAKRCLVSDLGSSFYTVAKDVKLQVEFNPAYISQYRLVGYENRLMNAEDFADDTKDGGEMGPGHTVVALYELIPAEGVTLCGVAGAEAAAENALRYQSAQTGSLPEIATVSVRAKAPDGEESRLYTQAVAPDAAEDPVLLRYLDRAQAIAEFGMVLRDSPYKANASYDRALALIMSLDGLSDDETEFMYLIIRAKRMS